MADVEAVATINAHRDLQPGLLQPALQCGELTGERAEFAVAEFAKDKVAGADIGMSGVGSTIA